MADEIDNDKTIQLACQGLRGAVNKYCKKRKRKKHPTEALEHACHLLQQLAAKHRSLARGLEVLETCCTTCCDTLLKKNQTHFRSILTHMFHQYLRLRDGMTLLTSGECRHDGDADKAKRTKFPSRLLQSNKRADGVTKLYASKHYSGYGWDEFFDPANGIQHRLLTALGSKCSWDTLLEYGAQMFETCLDRFDNHLQKCQQSLDRSRNTILSKLQSLKVTMVTQDKMERLQVTLPNGTQISLQRRANSFQVHDSNGCLPNEWTTVDQWNRVMQCPTFDKKRRIHTEEEHGLCVRVQKKVKVETTTAVEVSASDNTRTDVISTTTIKQDLHVNPQGLEASREELEAEGNEQKKDLKEITCLQEEINQSRFKVTRLQERVLAPLEKRGDVEEDDEELWDVRESLREARMTLGNHLLSLHAMSQDKQELVLVEARDHFCESRELVKKQQVVHEMVTRETNDFSEEARGIRRRLLLLRGRAHANMGNALVELGVIGRGHKSFESQAVDELKQAIDCTNKIRECVSKDKAAAGARSFDMTMDVLEADQLDALANRWLGKALWYQQRYKDAVLAFEQSSRFFVDGRQNAVTDPDMIDAVLELGTECSYACTLLADFAMDALERLQIVTHDQNKRTECLGRGEELFSIAAQAYKRALSIAVNIKKVVRHESTESVFDNYGFPSTKEIQAALKELADWWDTRKSEAVSFHGRRSKAAESNALRNDLFSSGPLRQQPKNLKRYTVQEGYGRRKRRKLAGHGGGNGTTIAAPITITPTTTKQYRKWGDELLSLPNKVPGGMNPAEMYPACAPELPPTLKPYTSSNY